MLGHGDRCIFGVTSAGSFEDAAVEGRCDETGDHFAGAKLPCLVVVVNFRTGEVALVEDVHALLCWKTLEGTGLSLSPETVAPV